MSIFDLDLFSKVIEWMPPYKRGIVMMRWVQSLVSQVQYNVNKMLYDFRLGSSYPNWIPGTYNIGNFVVYKFKVYECIADGTTATPPGTGWQLYLDNFVGSDERKNFNGQKIVLEYAMNTYYQTQFRQPPLQSDIYITNQPVGTLGFVVGQSVGSSVALTDAGSQLLYSPYATYNYGQGINYNGWMYISKTNNNVSDPLDDTKWIKSETIFPVSAIGWNYNFIINVPSATYITPQGSINFEMRQIVDKLVPESIKYIIRPY